MEIIDMDVLIIGSGIAGLRAALEVSRNRKRALLVSKAPLGRANNTYLSGGLFSFALDKSDTHKHIQKTLQSGRGLNDRVLVDTFAEEAPAIVQELKSMGMGGTTHQLGMVTRQAALIGGPMITPPLLGACRDAGVKLMEGIMVTDLLVEENACFGALGFDKSTGNIFGFRSQSVLLATGGAGAIYSQNDNAPGLTGDGYVLALKAGLELKDMEFVQFYPMVRVKGGQARMIIPAVLADIGKIKNKQGEDLKEKYNLIEKPIALTSRDRFARALFMEISRGEGIDGAIHLDLQGIKDSEIPFNKEVIEILKRKLAYHKKPVRIAPSCHHTMGGIGIDEYGRTSMKGLFAAGEVVGGIHGANRMGGNALSESAVFGVLAARSACVSVHPEVSSNRFQSLAEKSARETIDQRFSEGRKPFVASSLMGRIKTVLWEKAGIVRSGLSLKEAVRQMDEIHTLVQDQTVDNPKALCRLIECKNAALTGRAIAVAALERTESRGSHYREDYDRESEDWVQHIHVRLKEGVPRVSRVVPIET